MGMAASQARLIALTERMSDIEYQGQQINQQRTTLSNQVNALYNSLLTLSVPTPPSVSEYTSIKYSGAIGSTNFLIGHIAPTGNTYAVDLKYKKIGHFIEKAGTVAATPTPEQLKLSTITAREEETYIPNNDASAAGSGTQQQGTYYLIYNNTVSGGTYTPGTTYYVQTVNGYVKVDGSQVNTSSFDSNAKVYTAQQGDGTTQLQSDDKELTGDPNTIERTRGGYTESELNGYYVIDSNNIAHHALSNINNTSLLTKLDDGTYVPAAGCSLARVDSAGTAYTNGDFNRWIGFVGNNPCYKLSQAGSMISSSIDEYIDAIKHTFPDYYSATDDKIMNDFGVYFSQDPDTNRLIPHFVEVKDIMTPITDENHMMYIDYYDYIANGSYTEIIEEKDCLLTFDSSGRVTEIKLPIRDEYGNIQSYRSVKLEAEEITDNAAYQDACYQYEYEKYLYDKKQEEINAKTAIIQEQDKNLELKLTRLDNERKAVNTEIDAVKKVVDDNIQKSFKTFSG